MKLESMFVRRLYDINGHINHFFLFFYTFILIIRFRYKIESVHLSRE